MLNFDGQLLKLLLPAMHNPILIRQYLLKLQGTPLPVSPVLQYRKEVLAQAAFRKEGNAKHEVGEIDAGFFGAVAAL